MSDTIHSARGTRSVSLTMTSAVTHSRAMLIALTVARHRGPADTWTAARDRTADDIGVERTYAARIWNRWQEMKDVSGEALIRLSSAYVALCLHSEKQEAAQVVDGERIAREKAHEITMAAALERHSQQTRALGSRPSAPRAPSPLP